MDLRHAGPARLHAARQADALFAKLCCRLASRQATGVQHSKRLHLLSSSAAVHKQVPKVSTLQRPYLLIPEQVSTVGALTPYRRHSSN